MVSVGPSEWADELATHAQGYKTLGSRLKFIRHTELGPECTGCGTNFETPQAGQFCTGCGTELRAYYVPSWLRKKLPTAVQIFGGEAQPSEQQGSDVALVLEQKSVKPIAMSCPACSGGLTITAEMSRTIECSYCSVSVFLPAELWKSLHPAKMMCRWSITYQGKLKTAKQVKKVKTRETEEDRLDKLDDMYEASQAQKKAKSSERVEFLLWAFIIIAINGGVAFIAFGTDACTDVTGDQRFQ